MTPFEAELLRKAVAEKYGATATLADVGDYFFKDGGAGPDQRAVVKDTADLVGLLPGVDKKAAVRVGRFAGRLAPALSAGANVMDLADLVAGEDGLDNKLVDVAGMGIGGTIGGFLGGPLGASMGASAGKAVTDGIQGLFFGGKPETLTEAELLTALAQLEGRN